MSIHTACLRKWGFATRTIESLIVWMNWCNVIYQGSLFIKAGVANFAFEWFFMYFCMSIQVRCISWLIITQITRFEFVYFWIVELQKPFLRKVCFANLALKLVICKIFEAALMLHHPIFWWKFLVTYFTFKSFRCHIGDWIDVEGSKLNVRLKSLFSLMNLYTQLSRIKNISKPLWIQSLKRYQSFRNFFDPFRQPTLQSKVGIFCKKSVTFHDTCYNPLSSKLLPGRNDLLDKNTQKLACFQQN